MYSPLSNMFLAGIYEYLGNEKNFDIRFKLLVVHIIAYVKLKRRATYSSITPVFFGPG